jgi:hypothetical protein
LTDFVLPELNNKLIWECCAGDGRLAQAMRTAGYTVLASDIKPRGAGIARRDFLLDEPPQVGLVSVTNPPYNHKLLFLARGLQLLDRGAIAGLVFLIRWDAFMAAELADVFNRAAQVLTCCWRPVWIAGSKGNGRWSNAWVCWLPDHRGPPAIRWLQPGRRRRQLTLPIIKPG